jgi:hypothetical protein
MHARFGIRVLMKKRNNMKKKILTIKKDRNCKLMGASMPSSVHNYLSLYGAAKGSTKTDVLKPLITNWYNLQKEKETETMLVKEIITRIKNLRKIEKANGMMDLLAFKETVRTELQGKGIPDKFIVTILEEIK